MTEPRITRRKITDYQPDPSNANKGTERGHRALDDSVTEVGLGRSVLADKNGVLIAGNKTQQAAVDNGFEDVIEIETDGNTLVVVRRTDLDLNDPDPNNRARKAAYYDNRVGQLSLDWSPEQLLADVNAGVNLEAIFSDDELAELLADLQQEEPAADPGAQVDRAGELQKIWQVERGQVWAIGKHRLMCGDSTSAEDVARLMGDERAQLVVTSPPYNQNLETFKPSGMQKENPAFVNRMADSYFDSLPEDEYQTQQVKLLELLKTFCTPNASIFYNHKIRYREKEIVSPLTWLSRVSFPVRQEIIWRRGGSITLNARMFMPCDERIYWLRVGDDFVFNGDTDIKSWSTVWDMAAVNDVAVSAAFTIELPTRCIKACSHTGDIVLEPYAGSGTTMAAAHQLNRVCYGMEISPEYCAVILQRLQDMGLKPELET